MNTRRASVPLRIVLITALLWSPVRGADDAGSVRLANNEATQPAYVSPASWSTNQYGGGPVGMTTVGSPVSSRAADPFGIQFRFRSDINPAFVQDGYQTLGAMVPFHIDPGTSLVFLEGRGYVTNHNNYGGNAGLGYRYFSSAMNRMYSVSGWYDYDDSNYYDYSRWGISLASLTDSGIDYRLNGYIASGNSAKFVNRVTSIPTFLGFNIAQSTDTIFEVPYSGMDGEVGVPVPFLGDYGFKAYVGGYYMTCSGEADAAGPKVRLQGQLSQSVWGQIQFTDDDVFGANLMGSIAIDFPGGGRRPILTRQPTNMMLSQQVQREYRVPVNEKVTRESEVAINPVDNQPFIVYHVDNTARSGGNGSYESPYNTLPPSVSPEGDIIFVNRGDGTANGLSGGFTLQDNQRLLGEGTIHFYTSTEGTFELPGYTPGVNPLLGGTVNMVGDNTEIAGFRMAVPTDTNAINGYGEDFIIRDVSITRGYRGINLDNATGVGLITGVSIDGMTQDGIHADNYDATTLDLSIIDTTVTNGGETGIYATVDTEATMNILMDNVLVQGVAENGFGADVRYFNSFLGVDVVNSTFTQNVGDGFYVERVDDSGLRVDIADSIFDDNGNNGITVVSLNGRQPNSLIDIVRSSMSNNVGYGLQLHGEADVTLDVDLADNFINNNGFGGIHMTSFERILLRGVWERNEINDNGYSLPTGDGDGIYLQSNLDLVLTDNDVLRNNGDGLQVEIFGAANTTLDLNGNRINNNHGHGFDWESLSGGSTLFLDVDASDARLSQFNGNDGDGMEFRANGFATGDFIIASINETEVDFNDGRGIDILTQENSDAEYYITNSQISANGEEGVYLVNTSSATQTQDVPSSATLAADGRIDVRPRTTLFIDSSEIDANGAPGTMGGVVIRVGTSDGDFGYTFDGGYASDGLGGVIANLTNSNLSGNYGDDLVVQTYVSTVAVPDSAGTWSATDFTVDEYHSDPLARIDMVFHGNTADSINVINFGAYYDNTEATFKSRDNTQTDPGPFSDAARRRNATRLAFRGGLGPSTPGGASDSFLYPGIGESVMRVEGPLPGIENGVDILDPGFGGAVALGGPGNIRPSFDWQVVPPGTIFP